MAYTTLAQVKTFANVTNADRDGKISQIIPQVDEVINQAVGRFFDSRSLTAYKTQAPHDRARRLFIFSEDDGLNYLPILTVTTVKESGLTLVSGTDFFVEKSIGAFVKDVGFWTTLQEEIEITASFGFSAVPPDVALIATEMVAALALLLTKTFTTAAGEEQTVSFATAREYAGDALASRKMYRP